ncbi:APC family permease [Sphingomonas abietis]|uniref:Arginine/agmatine antiporter n=1 Tax=Sphingomonas abietis TaxID=3012344 RepID=A0ABY7NJL7_9SPHN|nr:APC family permease [Sphingomonas abietis]WBO21683.1 APC family permease [Sphingomonas abietis]
MTGGGGIVADAASRDAGLRRGIGTFALAAAIVNIVIGGGIFSLPAGMARAAGPYALVAYLLCALAMAAVVLCFAEAGSRVASSGGVYGYVEAAFGPLAGFVSGVLLWLSCVLACGGIAAGFADALAGFIPALATTWGRDAVIVAIIAVLTVVNLAGVRPASRLIGAVTAVKLIPLAIFVLVGLFWIDPAKLHAGTVPDVGGIGRAILLSLFAFQGMETTLSVSGEVDNPARTLPRALIGAMAFVTIAYVAIQWVAQGLLGGALAGAKAPLAMAMATIDPRLGLLLLVGTAISLGGWIGSDLLGAPRVLFAFARDGFLPRALGRLSTRQVPANAIVVHAAIAIVLAATGTFEALAILSALVGCALYIAGCAAAWRLRARNVRLDGTPLRLPVLGLWVVLGIGSMAACIALGRSSEIAALAGVILGSALLYRIARSRNPAR